MFLWVQGFHRETGKGLQIGLENAGQYLGDTFGPLMKYVWAVGLLAAGELRCQPSLQYTARSPDQAADALAEAHAHKAVKDLNRKANSACHLRHTVQTLLGGWTSKA